MNWINIVSYFKYYLMNNNNKVFFFVDNLQWKSRRTFQQLEENSWLSFHPLWKSLPSLLVAMFRRLLQTVDRLHPFPAIPAQHHDRSDGLSSDWTGSCTNRVTAKRQTIFFLISAFWRSWKNCFWNTYMKARHERIVISECMCAQPFMYVQTWYLY